MANIPYGNRGLTLDFYAPDGSDPRPAVVVFHGGGFVGGTEDSMRPFAADLVKRGYVVACPQYTLEGDAEDALPDAHAAVDWLLDRKECNGRLGALGSSAGGILAIGLALEHYEGVDAVAAWSGSAGSPVPKVGPKARPIYDGHGTKDQVVPFSEAKDLKAAYDDAGETMMLVPRKSSKHGLHLVDAYPDLKVGAYAHLDRYVKNG
jgi:dienelactone hydrolase